MKAGNFLLYTSLTIGALLAFCFGVTTVWAASPTPTASMTPTVMVKSKVDELKDRLATKVAELRTTQAKAISGTVGAVSVTSLTVETPTKDIKIELTDTIHVAQMIKGKRTQLTTSDISKGDEVTVFGLLDTTLDLLKAEAIFIQSPMPARVHGTIAALDKVEFTMTIDGSDGQKYIIDIEKDTKTISWTKASGLGKSGFSKVAVGEYVFISGTPDPKKENRLSGQRILDLGVLWGQTPTPTVLPTLSETPVSATASPTTKPTPKPTVKKTPTPTPSL